MRNMTNVDVFYDSDYSTIERTVLAGVLTLTFMLSLYGNVGMLVVLYKNDKMWNSTNILIGNLAITGVLVTCFSMPFSFVSIVRKRWPFEDGPVCKLNAFTNSLLLLVAIFIHTLISLDKYYGIVRPLLRAMTIRLTWIVIVTAWCIAILMSLGPFFNFGDYTYNRSALVCGAGFPNSNFDSIYMLLLCIIGFIIPNVISFYVYYKVFFAVRQHSHRLHKSCVTFSTDVVKLQRKLIGTSFLSLICFLLCWSPFAVYVTMAIVTKSIENMPHGLGVSAYMSGYFYNALNPLVICTMSDRFREGLYSITTDLLKTLLSLVCGYKACCFKLSARRMRNDLHHKNKESHFPTSLHNGIVVQVNNKPTKDIQSNSDLTNCIPTDVKDDSKVETVPPLIFTTSTFMTDQGRIVSTASIELSIMNN